MTAATMPAADRQVGDDVRVTFLHVLRSEWVRLRSLRSTWITMLITVALVIGVGALACYGYVSREHEVEAIDPTFRSLLGWVLGQLAFGVLGVLVVTGEYATGMIRATFTSVPQRMTVFFARLTVFVSTTLVVLVPTAIVAFLVGQTILARKHVDTTLGAPHVWRGVLGCALYLAAIGIFGMGLGWLIRNTAGAIFALVGVVFVAPIIAQSMPDPWPERLAKWLPDGAGQSIIHVHVDPHRFGPWAGYGVLIGYVVIVLAVAAALLRSRDV